MKTEDWVVVVMLPPAPYRERGICVNILDNVKDALAPCLFNSLTGFIHQWKCFTNATRYTDEKSEKTGEQTVPFSVHKYELEPTKW